MRKILLGSTGLAISLCLQIPQTGYAQTAATPAAKPSAQVQEVVITAQKRKERLSNVAVTADVLTSSTLAAEGVTDISDLSKAVPAISINASTNGRVPYAMRGVSTTANEGNVGLESSVGIMVDGVPIPSDSHAAQQITDLDNIQVLEGPQATLGGRTASSGLIDMVTRGPKPKWTGQVDAAFTTDGEMRGSAYIAGPIYPYLLFSLSGYGNQTPYPIKNLQTGKYTTQGATGVRGKLEYKPDALLDATLAGHLAESASYGDNFVYTYITPGSTLLSVPYIPGVTPNFGPSGLLPGITVSNTNLDTNTVAQNQGSRIYDRDISLNATYQLGNLTLGSTTAYQTESERDIQDLFNVDQFFFNVLTDGHLTFDNNQDIHNHVQQVSQEFKVTSPAEDRLNYVAGVFISDLNIHSVTGRNGLPPAMEDIAPHPETDTYDVYGRLSYKLTPQFSITGGLRFNDDQLRYQNFQAAYAPFRSDIYSSGHTNSGVVVGDISAQYNFDPRNMIYGTYARGYAPQAYNTTSPLFPTNPLSSTAPPLSPVARMDINHFEVGSKGRYLDGQATVSADLFYTIYDNYQIETFSGIPGLTNPPLILASAPEAQTHGAEVNAVVRPTAESTISVNAAYIDATFVTDKNGECWYNIEAGVGTAGTSCYLLPTGAPAQNVSGKPLPNSPKFKVAFNGDQRFPLNFIDYDVVAGATYTYRSSAQMLPDQSPFAVQRPFGILDLELGLESNTGNYSATLFVNNVTNQVYYTDIEDFFNSVWGGVPRNETVMGQPARDAKRFAGIRLMAKF